MKLIYKICALQALGSCIIAFFFGLLPMITFGIGSCFMMIASYFQTVEMLNAFRDVCFKTLDDSLKNTEKAMTTFMHEIHNQHKGDK